MEGAVRSFEEEAPPPLRGREGTRAFESTILCLPSALPKRSEGPAEENEEGGGG